MGVEPSNDKKSAGLEDSTSPTELADPRSADERDGLGVSVLGTILYRFALALGGVGSRKEAQEAQGRIWNRERRGRRE